MALPIPHAIPARVCFLCNIGLCHKQVETAQAVAPRPAGHATQRCSCCMTSAETADATRQRQHEGGAARVDAVDIVSSTINSFQCSKCSLHLAWRRRVAAVASTSAPGFGRIVSYCVAGCLVHCRHCGYVATAARERTMRGICIVLSSSALCRFCGSIRRGVVVKLGPARRWALRSHCRHRTCESACHACHGKRLARRCEPNRRLACFLIVCHSACRCVAPGTARIGLRAV